MSSRKHLVYVSLGLLAVIVAIYSHLWQCDFLFFDDNSHVFENPQVRAGLKWSGIAWALTTFHAAQWCPLTWMSHMLDVSWFGLDPGAHHLVAVGIHTLNAVLLCVGLARLTGDFWKSALVAALFAVHPMNVESVAWIAERKNLLSTLFWFLSLSAYAGYVRDKKPLWMVGVIVCMALGLMGKAMVVTLPCTLLLLDFWPLERWRREPWAKLFLEKLPLFLLSAAASWMQLAAAKHSDILVPTGLAPIHYRLISASANVVHYLGQMFFPWRLAILYPLPGSAPVLLGGIGLILMVGITWAAWTVRRSAPFLLMGWLWFLGVQVPVSGILQAGTAVIADRFMYVPQVGLWIAVVWAAAKWLPVRIPATQRGALACVVLAVFAARSNAYVAHWTDTAAVFEEAARVTKGNFVAHGNAGYGYARRGDLRRAVPHYLAALAIEPRLTEARSNLGVALSRLGQSDAAAEQFRQALDLNPGDYGARINLAAYHVQHQRPDSAIELLTAPEASADADTEYWLGRAWGTKGNRGEAERHFRTAAGFAPEDLRVAAALADLREKPARTSGVEP